MKKTLLCNFKIKRALLCFILLLTSFFGGLSFSGGGTLKAQGLWTQKASIPCDTTRAYAVGFSIGNYGYVGLGLAFMVSQYYYYHDFWRYDPISNTWTKLADFPGKARMYPQTFVIGNNAYIVMGQDSTESLLNECWEYNTTTNVWKQKNNFPGTIRYDGVGFSVGNKGFFATGWGSPFFKDVWEYDTTTDAWTQKNNFPGLGRFGSSAWTVGGNAYIYGGEDSLGFTNELWEYDTATDTWTQKTSKPSIGTWGGGFVIGDNIYEGMGQDSTMAFHKDFWKYNTLSDTWSKQDSFPDKERGVCSSFAIGSKGYLGFGTDSDIEVMFNDLYQFTPDTTTGIENMAFDNNTTVYPNPSNGIFTVSCHPPVIVGSQQSTIEIYNVLGVRICTETLRSAQGDNTVDISNQPSGTYIIKINSANQIFYSKIVINH